MITVHKYTLKMGENVIPLPYDYETLFAAEQEERVRLWVKVDTNDIRTIKVFFHVAVTGAPLPNEPLKFISTILMDKGRFVLHVFEQLERALS